MIGQFQKHNQEVDMNAQFDFFGLVVLLAIVGCAVLAFLDKSIAPKFLDVIENLVAGYLGSVYPREIGSVRQKQVKTGEYPIPDRRLPK